MSWNNVMDWGPRPVGGVSPHVTSGYGVDRSVGTSPGDPEPVMSNGVVVMWSSEGPYRQLGLERRNSDDARHPLYRSTTKHITWEVRHDTGDCSLVAYRRFRRNLGVSRATALERFRPRVGGLHGWGCFFH